MRTVVAGLLGTVAAAAVVAAPHLVRAAESSAPTAHAAPVAPVRPTPVVATGGAASTRAVPSPTTVGDAAHAFARELAADGPRPAASAAERAGQRAAAARFRAAGLAVSYDRFTVPGKGRSRNVVARRAGAGSCLRVFMAHADSTPTAPGALDNASGVGMLVALAPVLAAEDPPRCETWLVATGAEERLYTGRPDHLGASALVRRLRHEGRTRDVRWALSLDEVGAGSRFDLYSPARRARAGVEREVLTAARTAGVRVRRVRDAGTGNSDHREIELAGMPGMKLGVVSHACRHTPCDTAGQLRKGAFRRVASVVVPLVRAGAPAATASVSSRASAPVPAGRRSDPDTPADPAEAR